jgi:hypothetical protein
MIGQVRYLGFFNQTRATIGAMSKHKFPLGNKFGGRTLGAKNKPRTPSFVDEDQRLAPARRFRVLIEPHGN